jgi:NADH-quinone oxidoreductase subunit N
MLAAAATIHTPHIRYLAIMPEIVMFVGAVLLLAVSSLVRRPLRVSVATAGTVVISLTALGFALWQWADVTTHGPFTAVDGAIAVDGFSVLVAILVPCAMALTALVGDGYLRREGVSGPEFHVLALSSATGAMLMGAANDLIIIFLGLEILSIALYVLTAFNHRRAASGEAALKYFVLGGFSSAIFVYGIALVYGATGSTNLVQIADFLSRSVVTSDGLLLGGLALLLVGFAFKIAAVPFHMWTPDVYQGAPSPVTGFMAAVAKVGAFAALLRVFISSFGVLRADWQPVIYALALVTLVVGAVLAIVQRDVKRMLAYSSINHAGFILMGLQAATAQGVSASLYYLFVYTFMVIGTFAIVTVLGRSGDTTHDISTYRGLARRQPLVALCLAVLLLAQAGAPFTTGLWAKLQVVLASVDANSVPLAVVAMVSAALAAFFYLRLAVLMYTPPGWAGTVPGVEADAEDPLPLPAGGVGPADLTGSFGPHTTPVGPPPIVHETVPVWTGAEASVATVDQRNAALLLGSTATDGAADGALAARPVAGGAASESAVEAESAEVVPDADRAPVPALTAVAIGLCVAFTVVFGIFPAPLIDLAHQATLLFLP